MQAPRIAVPGFEREDPQVRTSKIHDQKHVLNRLLVLLHGWQDTTRHTARRFPRQQPHRTS